MRYVHDGKELKTNQSIGVEKIDDNTYCFVYAYCSPKDQYSKKKAREIINQKYEKALEQRTNKEYSITAHELNGTYVIDTLILENQYLSNLIYNMYFPRDILLALSKHTNLSLFTDIELLKIESKELRKIAMDVKQYVTSALFGM